MPGFALRVIHKVRTHGGGGGGGGKILLTYLMDGPLSDESSLFIYP